MNDDPPLPLSALEHHLYCPRQAALIHVDGVWVDNPATVRGSHGHRRADTAPPRTERGRLVLRGVPLWSERLNLTGRADTIELHPDGSIVPVEYKIGHRHGLTGDVQLCAQALCLEEMIGIPVPYGYLWYAATRRRRRVTFESALRSATLTAISEARQWLAAQHLPPAVDDERCPACQLRDHCQPELAAHPELVDRYLDQVVFTCDS